MESLLKDSLANLERLLDDHPCVGAYSLHRDGERVLVQVEPDPQVCPELAEALAMSGEVRAAGLDIFEPGKKWLLVGKNKLEADFLYREIVEGNEYLKHGISLDPGATVVDVGANVGMFSLLAAKAGAGRVIAVEPVPELAQAIRFNARLHGFPISVYACALGAARDEIEFTYYPHNTVMSGRFAEGEEDRLTLRSYLSAKADGLDAAHLENVISGRMAGRKLRCPMHTLMDIVGQEKLEGIDLLKVDAEKSEYEVLRGIAEPFWQRIRQVVLEVHDEAGRQVLIKEMLESRGFRVECDRNADMALTNMFTLYARRPGGGAGSGTFPTIECATPSSFEDGLRDRLASALQTAGLEAEIRLEDRISVTPNVPARESRREVSAVEARFRTVWREILRTDTAEPDSDFFALGGTSLGAVRMIMRLEESFGKDCLPPENFFGNSRYRDLVRIVEDNART